MTPSRVLRTTFRATIRVVVPSVRGPLCRSGFVRRVGATFRSPARWREHLPGLGPVAGWIESGPSAGKVRENLLRALYAARLPEEGRGLLVHAASVRAPDGSAWLFPGKSGAGKSTLAGLAVPSGDTAWRAIAEDVSVVTWPGPMVGGTLPPVLSDVGADLQVGPPLRAIGFLEHAPAPRAESLSRPAALRRLLECAVWFGSDGAVGAILDQAVRLVSAVPCYRIGFRPDGSVWTMLGDLKVAPTHDA